MLYGIMVSAQPSGVELNSFTVLFDHSFSSWPWVLFALEGYSALIMVFITGSEPAIEFLWANTCVYMHPNNYKVM